MSANDDLQVYCARDSIVNNLGQEYVDYRGERFRSNRGFDRPGLDGFGREGVTRPGRPRPLLPTSEREATGAVSAMSSPGASRRSGRVVLIFLGAPQTDTPALAGEPRLAGANHRSMWERLVRRWQGSGRRIW